MRTKTLLFLSVFLAGPTAIAADPPSLFPEVLVTAPAHRLAPNSSLTASVLDREDLDAYGARTLGDALNQAPGVDTASLGPAGSSQLVSLRGASAEQVLVLLDGRRLNPFQGGGADLSLVPLGSLERVEIIRGCAPSRYGVDGLGGVVNLVTSSGVDSPPSGRLETASGSGGTRRLSGSLATAWGAGNRLRFSLAGSLESSAPTFLFDDPLRSFSRTRENTDTSLRNAGAGIDFAPAARGTWRVRLKADQFVSRRGSPGLAEFPTRRARLDETGGAMLLGADGGDPAGGRGLLSFSLLSSRRTLRYHDPDALPLPALDSHETGVVECAADHSRFWGGRFLLRTGSALSFRRLDSTTDGRIFDRNIFVSFEPRILLGRFEDARYDEDGSARLSVEGGWRAETSRLHPFLSAPRAGILLMVHRGTRTAFRVNGGRLVRNPSFDDLFFSQAAFAKGDPALRPEKAWALDVGILASPGPLSLSLTGFFHDVRDLIQWSPDFAGRWRPLNLSRARIAGFEGEGSFSFRLPGAWRGTVEGSFTALRAVDRSGTRNLDGKLLPRRPPFKSSAGIRLNWRDRFRGFWRTRFVSYRYLDTSNTRYLPGCYLHATGVGFSPARGFGIFFSVQNLADRSFVDLNDYPLPGRQWEVRTSLAF